MVRRLMLMTLALLAVVGLSTPQAIKAATMNYVRVMHASPDAPAVDIFVDGKAVLTSVPFFALSGQLALPDGTYTIDIAPAGAGVAASVFETKLTLEGGYTGTVAAVGSLGLGNFDVKLYEDNYSMTGAGMSRVRVIHGSPDAPAVDIKIAGTQNVVVKGAKFGDAATLEVPAGSYSFDISPAGSSTVLFTTPALRFESGWGYSLVASGFASKNFWVQSRVDMVK